MGLASASCRWSSPGCMVARTEEERFRGEDYPVLETLKPALRAGNRRDLGPWPIPRMRDREDNYGMRGLAEGAEIVALFPGDVLVGLEYVQRIKSSKP